MGDCFDSRRIVVKFSMRPAYHDPVAVRAWCSWDSTYRRVNRSRSHISWEYKLSAVQDDTVFKNLSLVNKESFKFVEEESLVWLQIGGQGKPIRFRPKIDTIYMDPTSLFCLNYFLKTARTDPKMILRGFDKIESLETSLSFPRPTDPRAHNGFREIVPTKIQETLSSIAPGIPTTPITRTAPTSILVTAPPMCILGGLDVSKIIYDLSPTVVDNHAKIIYELNDDLVYDLLASSVRPSETQQSVVEGASQSLVLEIRYFFRIV